MDRFTDYALAIVFYGILVFVVVRYMYLNTKKGRFWKALLELIVLGAFLSVSYYGLTLAS